ncbi:YebC/PmpR family DNA-binding transcriptional regulator [Kiritimatiella glycovorans]|uniref:Probable transcriptional regulatory protein L21SP4_01193 n=1 Tax=Kiritimatiella glycovorans TaxID=1307763 RepID=A0A0G3EDA8_9BACT|nr:YebC/PmpR family DNA-binding transcriptional regulator [Kiritimatiella glycovorans]AKJ64441.1 putative transcriptional regulatory protein [Kiritimatiella glycovorans]
MAGHSKWANIKHKKGRADAARGKLFSKLAKDITVAAREGGGDADMNITLRTCIQKAREANMPADNIDRAVKKGTGELGGAALEETLYEGYAQGGVGLLVHVLTDNRNRSASEVRSTFTRNGGNLAESGAVSHMFQRKGQILVDGGDVEEDRLMNIVLEAGAEDMKREGDQFEIITDPVDFSTVCEALEQQGVRPDTASVTMLPDVPLKIDDREQAAGLIRFVEELEDLDDVQNVYGAFDIDDDVLEALSEQDA